MLFRSLDRSGSMSSLWSEAIGSINAYVEKLPKETQVYMSVFDNEYDVIRQSNAGSWKPINNDEVSPRGMTALFDASARIMQRAIDDNAEKTVIVVMTDGEENSSRHFRQTDVKQLVAKLDSKKWEIVFLGANFDAVDSVSGGLGLVGSKSMNIAAGNLMRGFDTLSTYTQAYATTGASINFTQDDKTMAVTK